MALQIYNMLTRQKETFEPLQEGRVNMYVCGPTVQDYAHIGHAKTYVAFDVVVRFLRYMGNEVLYVQNITDVGHLLDTGEDRILKKARQVQAKPMQIAEYYTRSYYDDMDALGVVRPDIAPRASGHVPEQIAMIRELIDKGHAYVVDGNVYFDVTSFADYGKLSGRRLDEQEAGTREAVREEKRHPADFALWKRAEPEHILRWDSPWGEGYPGWHIECSAMSRKYLGETFDIHGGGVDNIFPHNECEIAQSEAATGKPFARYWILVGSLTFDGVKMSKSLGNFLTIRDALRQHRPEAVRMFVLNGHYRSPVDFTEDAMHAATRGWERLMGAVRLTRERLRAAQEAPDGTDGVAAFEDTLTTYRARFIEAMEDDFNTSAAIAALQELTREVNTLLNSGEAVGRSTLEAIDTAYRELGGQVLGLVPDEETQAASAEREDGLIRILIELRNQARLQKQFETADRIRDRLAELGVTLEDRPEGTTWRTA
ncbi:MAG: cysteine--tRNA ligase [Anaerolineae bacterium]|nr:cysteine--tRNA ligase [Anaerolineae bacterium]